MNRDDIKKIIPHRDPMLLVDYAEITSHNKAKGSYTIKGDEAFLQGHFPGNPVVPGVILCEIMGQASSVMLAGREEMINATPFFTGIKNAKFKNVVHPGDTLEIECELVKQRGNFFFANAKGYVREKLAVSAEFSFALVKNAEQ